MDRQAIKEEWRPIPDFLNYEVSSIGRVRRAVAGKTGQHAGMILKHKVAKGGYLQVGLYRDGKFHWNGIHRRLCLAFHGPCPSSRHTAAHRDGVRDHNTVENIRWATWEEQVEDRNEHGHYWHVLGEDHPMHVLNDELVLVMRARWNDGGVSIKAMAREVGHAYLTVYDAVKGTTWRHL